MKKGEWQELSKKDVCDCEKFARVGNDIQESQTVV